jgi:hypothetical protein
MTSGGCNADETPTVRIQHNQAIAFPAEEDAMFGEDRHDSIIQRGIDEALACQDMLARAPAKPSRLARLRARFAAVRVGPRRAAASQPRVVPAAPVRLIR